MSGRGGQGFQSSRGKGRGSRSNDNTKYKSCEQHKTLQDYVYHIGSAKQASDYVTQILLDSPKQEQKEEERRIQKILCAISLTTNYSKDDDVHHLIDITQYPEISHYISICSVPMS